MPVFECFSYIHKLLDQIYPNRRVKKINYYYDIDELVTISGAITSFYSNSYC